MLQHLKKTYWVLLWLATHWPFQDGDRVEMSGAVEFSLYVYISIGFGLNASHMVCVLLLGNTPGWVATNTIDISMAYTVYPQTFKYFNASENHRIKKFSRNTALKSNASRLHVLCNDPLIRSSAEKYLSSKPCFMPEKKWPLKKCYRMTWGWVHDDKSDWTISFSVSQLPRNVVACIQLSD